MKKKIIAILMAGCMTCSLAACGSDEGEKGKEGKEKITFVPVSYTHLTLPTILRV